MHKIELDGVSYNLPEAWDEVDEDQLPRLIELVYITPEGGKMYHALIQLALNIRPKAWRKIHQRHFGPKLSAGVRRKNAEVLQQIVSMLSWLWDKPMDKQPFAVLEVEDGSFGGQTWLLPEPDFATMSFGELTDLYIHLQNFIQQTVAGDDELDYLVATACRPERRGNYRSGTDWNGDAREPYNEFQVRERVKLVSQLDFKKKMAVMLYVASTIRNVMSRYTLFDQAPSDTTKKEDTSREVYAGQGFVKNQHLLAEKGIFGNLKQTQQANLHEVLLFLEEHRADLLAKQAANQ